MTDNNITEILEYIILQNVMNPDVRTRGYNRVGYDIMSSLFEDVIEDMYEIENNYISNMEQKMLDAGLHESLESYKTYEKKPNIRLDVESKSANSDDCKENCSICNCQIEINEMIANLHCNHIFHTNCISEWVMYKPECPCCRSSISIKNVNDPLL
jgi:hypothetical protein